MIIMYIKTENYGIINTHHFDRIDVYSEGKGSYTIRAFTNPIPDSINAESLIIAVFDNKTETDSALLNLFDALSSCQNTWDPGNLKASRFNDKLCQQHTSPFSPNHFSTFY